MPLTWTRESPPLWDGGKARIVGATPPGVFALGDLSDGTLVPGDWWRVERDGQVVGYGWMDHAWGDAEVLLAVAPGAQAHGVGTFILDRLEDEAAGRGINYLYNVVPAVHPERERLTRWLLRRGFTASHEGDPLKRPVRPRPA
jgi:N-acetylglutamate synthase-like GNAT family acetyltransferase